VRAATAFLDENHPTVWLYGRDKDGHEVNVSFSRERDDPARQPVDTDWVCSNVRTTL
jgi:hypothetical protein